MSEEKTELEEYVIEEEEKQPDEVIPEEPAAEEEPEEESLKYRRPDETPAERKARQRKYKMLNEQRRREMEVEINSLRQQVQKLSEHRFLSEHDKLQQELQTLDNYERQIAERAARAISENDGETAVEAQKLATRVHQMREAAIAKQQYLAQEAKQFVSSVNQTPAETPDPKVQTHVYAWMSKTKDWYNPSGQDPESRLVNALDSMLTKEGWDPSTPDYWQELEKKVSDVLPHRFGKTQTVQHKSGPPVSSGTSSQVSSGGRSVKLPKDFVDGLRDAGLWDSKDPKVIAIKNNAIKNYLAGKTNG